MTCKFDTVFLDRDGTINVKAAEGSYILRPEDVSLLPGAGEAVYRLNAAGLRVIVVTNQRAVALGLIDDAGLAQVNRQLEHLLAAHGAHLDGIYVCPHDSDSCGCRKPKAGLLKQAREDFPNIDYARSMLIGDSESDVQAALACGIEALRLAPTHTPTRARALHDDLADAVEWILSPQLGGGCE
jgi:D-glycero-D-manno-heptose 1,7-bisphosphate phosphatase